MKLPPPLRVSIPIALMLFGIIAGWASYKYEQHQDRVEVEREFTDRALFLGTKLSAMIAYFLESGSTAGAQREVSLSSANPNLRHVIVLDGDDKVMFATSYELLSQPIAKTHAAKHLDLIASARRTSAGQTYLHDNGESLAAAFPFPIVRQSGSLRESGTGIVFVEFNLTHPKAVAKAAALRRLELGGGVLLLLCIGFTLFFYRTLTSRLVRLVGAAERIAKGDLNARAKLGGTDELAQLSRAYDEMAEQLQRRDAELLEGEQRFRQMAENVGEIFWLYDFDLKAALYINPAFEQIFQQPGVDFLKSTRVWHDALHPEDKEWVMAAFTRERERSHDLEYRIVRPDGSVRWLRDRSFRIPSADGIVRRVAGVAEDITARKLADAEKTAFDRKLQETQRLESLGVLAGGIAHDFNNLLTGVLGHASLARMTLPASSEAQQNLTEIEQVAMRAAELCKQMLAYSGKGRFEVQLLDLSTLVEDTTKLLQLSIAKNAILRFDLARGIPPVQADATQLRQVVMNLVINGSEALDGKSGAITLRTGLARVDASYLESTVSADEIPPGDYVYLEVADSGCGMPHETRARIFEPFFTTKFTGRGLGLSAVLGIVRGHRGALKVYSEPGKGTTFKLLFPVAEGHAQPLNEEPAGDANWKSGGRVLVVDDEDTVRTVSARMLESFGFTPSLAVDGAQGVEVFKETPEGFVAVLMDLTMPRLDGEEAFRRLRQLNPNVRVILMSGFNEQEAINRFTGKGLAGFLQKPFKPAQLRAKLRELLTGKN